MFRHLGRFALLALCLFALVIAMGSCGEGGVIEGTESTETVGTETSEPSAFDLSLERAKERLQAQRDRLVGEYKTRHDGWEGELRISTFFSQHFNLNWTNPQGRRFPTETGTWGINNADGSEVKFTDSDTGLSLLHKVTFHPNGIRLTNMWIPDGRPATTVAWLKQ